MPAQPSPHPPSWNKKTALLRIAEALERLSPPPPDITLLENHALWAFIFHNHTNAFLPIKNINTPHIDELHAIDVQKKLILENMRYFAKGYDTNHTLLWGARGMGKSSLVKACLLKINAENPSSSIAMIEIPHDCIKALPLLITFLSSVKRRLILFFDDLSFEAQDNHYKILKSLLDGGLCGLPAHICIYATSNRRHLMPRDMIENEKSTAMIPHESLEEKISLSDRFGLWVGFYPLSQEDYLIMVTSYAQKFNLPMMQEILEKRALQWAQQRGSRSGRVAFQFMTALKAELLS